MRRSSSSILLGTSVVGLLVLAATTVVRSQPDGAAAPKTGGPCDCIAILDLVRIFNESAQIKDLNDEINKKQTELQAEAQQRAKNIENKQAELSAFQPGTADYDTRRKELMRLNVESTVWLKATEQDLEVQKFNWTRVVYEKACKVSEDLAKQRGFAFVLQRKDFKPAELDQTVQSIRRVIQERDVIYAAPNSDITDVVLQRLDQEYKASGGKQSAAAPARPRK